MMRLVIVILVKLLILMVMLLSCHISAQVGINTASPNAQLDIRSTNQAAPNNNDGILIPKVDAFPITNPTIAQNGMMVFLTMDSGSNPSGFYYWDDAAGSWTGVGGKEGWKTKGNTGTNSGTDFLGTTDNQPLVIGTNNTQRMLIDAAGNIGLGNATPVYPFQFPNTLGDKLCLYNSGATNYGFGIQSGLLQIHSSGGFSDIAFGYGTSVAFTEAMRIKGSGNVGIGTASPFAKFQINASNQVTPSALDGIIIPRVDNFPASNPGANQNGMMVFLTTAIGTNQPGFYYWDNIAGSWTGVGARNNWGLAGNQGTNAATNFMGTTDDTDFVFKRNNLAAGRVGTTNTALGNKAFATNTGTAQTAVGNSVLTVNTSGSQNTAVGHFSMAKNLDGGFNTAIGAQSLRDNTSGNNNTAVGSLALLVNDNGTGNTAIGHNALFNNVSGGNNTAVGNGSGTGITSGSGNITLGTAGQVADGTASNQLAIANAIYGTQINAIASANIGIGTQAPASKFHVMASASGMTPNANSFATFEKTGNGYLSLLSGTGETGIVFGTGGVPTNGALVYNAASNTDGYSFRTSGNINKLMVSSAGYVGIGGATVPSFPLQFQNVLGDKIDLYGTTTTYGFGIQSHLLQIHADDTSSDVAIGMGNSASFTERMRVKGSGRVGIGTTSPASRLHIYESDSGMTPNPSATLTIEKAGWNYLNLLSTTESGILFGANNFGSDGGIVYNSSVPQGLSFRTNGNQNRMTLSSDGNLGIGDLTATYPLQFANAFGDKICLYDSGSTTIGLGLQNNLFQFHSDTNAADIAFGYGSSASFTENLRIKGTGAVGIGTSNPSAKLQIVSSNQATPANTDGVLIPKVDNFPLTNPTASQEGMMIYLTTTIGSSFAGFYYWDNSSVSWLPVGSKSNWSLNGNANSNPSVNYIGTSDNNDLVVKTNGNEAMRVSATGDVGIKTNSPGADLEVNGYTKLGSNAPAIKFLKLTGTTAASQGSTSNIAHGLTVSKILSVSVLVEYSTPSLIAPSWDVSGGYEYSYFVTSTNVGVTNKTGNSANILSKPIRILITYEE